MQHMGRFLKISDFFNGSSIQSVPEKSARCSGVQCPVSVLTIKGHHILVLHDMNEGEAPSTGGVVSLLPLFLQPVVMPDSINFTNATVRSLLVDDMRYGTTYEYLHTHTTIIVIAAKVVERVPFHHADANGWVP